MTDNKNKINKCFFKNFDFNINEKNKNYKIYKILTL